MGGKRRRSASAPRRVTRSKVATTSHVCTTATEDRRVYDFYRSIFEQADSSMCGWRKHHKDPLLDFSTATNIMLTEQTGLGVRNIVGAVTLRPWGRKDLEIVLFGVKRSQSGKGLGRQMCPVVRARTRIPAVDIPRKSGERGHHLLVQDGFP